MIAALGVVRRILRDATDIDTSGVKLRFAIRCTAGVAIPLVVALLLGQPLAGVSAAIGALSVGFASRQGAYRTRAAAMLFTAFGMSFSAFVGSLTGGDAALNVAAAAAWGLGFGILASLGPTANVVGLNSCIALAIFGQFRYTPAQAALQATLVLSGGVLQTLLLVSVWPLQRFSAERKVLAKAYRALADYAGHISGVALKLPDEQTFATLSTALADPQPFARRGEIAAFEALLDEAERIRATLAALNVDRYALEHRERASAAATVAALGDGTRGVLREIAAALEAARAPHNAMEAWRSLEQSVASLEGDDGDPRAAEDAHALHGQLRSAWRATGFPVDAAPARQPPRTTWFFRRSTLVDGLQTLQANCSLDSAYAQHGIRLALTLAVAAAASHVFPLGRGYWAALTVALVLRPDFATTFARGAARVIGTLIGALVASSVAALFRPGPGAHLVLALLFAGLGYALFDVNYAVFSATITAYVVFLLAFGGLPEHTATLERVEATLVGGALALAAYGLWPTWERELAPKALAGLVEKQRVYLKLVLDAYPRPDESDGRAIRDAQRAAWLARTNAEASVDRMLGEPVRPKALTVRAALGVLAATRRIGLAVLALRAHAPSESVTPAQPLEALADGLDHSLEALVQALRERSDPPELPPLRRLQLALAKALEAGDQNATGLLIAESDLIVDGVNTIADLLHRLHRTE